MQYLRRLLALLVMFAFAPLAWAITADAQLSTPHPPGWGYPSTSCSSSCVSAPPATASLRGTRRMYDSVDLSALPNDPFAAAGYTSGFWPTYGPIRARWPRAHSISIAVTASEPADCLDIEPGDATPAEAPAWVRTEKAHGVTRPCLYSSYWELVNEVRPTLTKAGVKLANVYQWDADYDLGCPRLDEGFDATQCTDHALGHNLDESVVTLRFLQLATPPYRPHVKEIRKLQARRILNERRERRQKCGHLRKPQRRDRARCSIERRRVSSVSRQIKRLERS